MTRRRRPALLLLIAFGLWLVAIPAAGHDELTSSNPGDAQVLARVPASVVLTFSEPALALGTQVLVTGPRGPVQQGSPVLVDDTVTQSLRSDSPAGDYRVDWRVTSADGHPISGSFTFSAGAAGRASSADPTGVPSADLGSSGRSGTWIWVIGGLLVAGTALSALELRRRGRPSDPRSADRH